MRVLIVDDDAAVRQLVGGWADLDGATVLEARTALEGLAACEKEAPAIAFCDLGLPGHDGMWLAEQLRLRAPDTAVVIMTAVNEFSAAVSGIQLGVVDYLAKPFSQERFSQGLQRAFAAHQSRRALGAMHDELARRRSQIADALAELELNVATNLEAMLEIMRLRDAGTYEHAHRVARLAVDLAMTLQVGEPHLSDIERGALLHELGRLALPDALLRRAERDLSPSERAQLRSYPLHGFAMLRNVPYLTGANEIAVAAHERYDGSGFPRGLSGDAIPLGARLIGVANAFDALVSAAVNPLTIDQAIEVLTAARAPEFDPLVLGALKILHPSVPSSHIPAH